MLPKGTTKASSSLAVVSCSPDSAQAAKSVSYPMSHTNGLFISALVVILPDVTKSELGQAGRVSVLCDRMRFDLQRLSQCGSTYNCISRPETDLHYVCCLDAKQWGNKNSRRPIS